MRIAHILIAACLFALLCVSHARAQFPPLPVCSTLSTPVFVNTDAPEGTTFNTSVSCSSAPQWCGCIPSVPLPYGVSIVKTVVGNTCNCEFTTLHDTPGGILSVWGCAACQ